MNSRAFCLFIFCVFVLESIFAVSDAVSNYSHEQNQITEQERRAADKDKQIQAGDDQTKSDTRKRALFSIGNKFSSSYPSSSSSGYGSSGYGHGYSLGGGGGGFSSSGSGYGGHHQYQGGHHYLPPSSHGFDHGGGHSGGHGGGGLSHHGGISSSLALKGLLIPIAGIALLGAAAALSTNPVLLQLGVINGRRKRSLKQSKEEISRKLIGEIQSASPKCLKETGATNADVAILLRHQMPESRNGKCLLFCLHKHFHIQTADGTTDPDGVLKFLEYVKSEDANVYDLITKIVDNCRNVEIDADPCNTAVNIGKCAVAESKKIGLGAELFDMEII